MDTELKFYRKIAEKLYSQKLIPEDGVALEEIERAEKSHGFQLPKVLRELYLMVGNHEPINASHNELLAIDCLTIEANKLIFYQENQGVCYWAIALADIGKDNPPVWVGQSIVGQEELEWYLETENLSDFLLIMLCWQSVMGGLPFVGLADSTEESVIQRVKSNFSYLEVEKIDSGFQSFIDEGKVICLDKSNEETTIYAGASDENKFLEIEDLLNIEWDYCSLDD